MTPSVDAITRLVYRYCELFDAGDFDAYAQQFEHGSLNGRAPGAAELRRWLDERIILYGGSPRTKHLVTNLVVDVDEEAGSAAAHCYVTMLQAVPGGPLELAGSAEYRDRFERVDGAWRWAARDVVNVLGGDPSRHVRPGP